MFKRISWFYKCITYYNYRWQIKVKGAPEMGAASMPVVCALLNILGLSLIADQYWNHLIIPTNLSTATVVVIGGFFIFVNYYYLTKGKSYRLEKIKGEFENVSKNVERRRIVLCVAYTVGSILFPFVFGNWRVAVLVAIAIIVPLTPLLLILFIVRLVKKRKKSKQTDVLEKN